jgi:hypothetical protein
MPVFQANTRLERVVVEVGLVLLLVDLRKSREDPIEILIQRAIGNSLPVVVRVRRIVRID